MADKGDIEQSGAYGVEALTEMKKRDIAAIPENYAVWYTYVTGSDSELRRTVDTLTGNRQEFDPFRLKALFDDHVLPKMAADAIGAAGEELTSIADQLGDAIGSANANVQSYGETLATASNELEGGQSDVANVVSGLIQSTKNMQEKNEELQSQIEEASSEIETLRAKLEEARRESDTDGLTQISNRKCFDRVMKDRVMEAMSGDSTLCLVMVDIDFFKKFNDNYGHQLGDQVLKLVAKTLTTSVREGDLPARYGGEEFSVVLPNADLEVAREIAERIRKRVGAKKIVKRSTGEDLGNITMSLGIARYDIGESMQDLIKRADEALYAAKRTGRNRVLTEVDLKALQDA